MWSPSVVAGSIVAQCPRQLPMAKDENVIQTFRPYRSHPSLRNGIRLRSLYRRSELLNAKSVDSPIKDSAVATVPVMNEMARQLRIDTTGFNHLLCQPLRRGMRSHTHEHNLPYLMLDDKVDIQRSKQNRAHSEEIACPDILGVLLK